MHSTSPLNARRRSVGKACAICSPHRRRTPPVRAAGHAARPRLAAGGPGGLAGPMTVGPGARADWRPALEGGTSLRSGSTTQRLRGTLSNPDRPLSRAIGLEIVRDSAAGTSVLLDGRAAYWLTRSGYGFVDLRALHDEPLGIDRQFRAIAGPGLRFQRTPAGAVGLEAGAGVVHTRLDERFVENERTEGIGLLRIDGFRNVLDRFRVDGRAEAARTSSLTELRAEVSLALSLGVGSVRYTLQTRRIDPDDGVVRKENHAFVSFGYRF